MRSWVGIAMIVAFGAGAPAAAQSTGPENDLATAVADAGNAPASISDRLALPPEAGLLLAPASAESAPAAEPVVAMRQTSGRGTALAIVGGALFVGGLVAGGDAGTAMVVVGAAVGAYGLYLMLSS